MSAELDVLPEVLDAEVLGPPMAEGAAKKLDKRIRLMADDVCGKFETLGNLIDEAKHGQIHVALGFPSWPAYLADALGGRLELTGETRREVVALMAGEGMSLRAIGQATGVSKDTVARDLAEVASSGDQVSHSATPDGSDPRPSIASATVTGIDGKVQARTKRKRKPRPKPEPSSIAPFDRHADWLYGAAGKLETWVHDHPGDVAEWVAALRDPASPMSDRDRSALCLAVERIETTRQLLGDLLAGPLRLELCGTDDDDGDE